MSKSRGLFLGLVFLLNLIVVGQNVPNNISPNGTFESTKVYLNYTHESGNVFYDFQIDTLLSFNTSLLKEVIGLTNQSGTLSGVSLTDSVDNLHYGKKYYWRSRSRTLTDTSLWSNAIMFNTLDAPIITTPINNATLSPSNFFVHTVHNKGNKEYYYELASESGFNYPIYFNGISMTFSLNPGIPDGTSFSTLINGLPSSGDVYIRLKVKNDVDSSEWSDVVKVFLDEKVSIDENNIESANIYPNPSNGIFNLSSSALPELIQVFDINGKIVYIEKEISSTVLDLRILSNGFYTIRMKFNDEVLFQKIQLIR